MTNHYKYLALGDSYTIGEALPLIQNFPYQVVQRLRKSGHQFTAPEIIAQTGWTTDELLAALDNYAFLSKYDFITLLIGVNNQYRAKTIEEYTNDLEKLLLMATELAIKKSGVIVVSIPDYSVTPFAKDKDPDKIAREIDIFNAVNKALSVQYKVQYVEITEQSREAATNKALLAADMLHPSALEYEKWAEKISQLMISQIK